jgi:hypothetical protein
MQVIFPQQQQPQAKDMHVPANISVPFLKQPIGLGDVVAGATETMGITPCGGCQKRKEALNRAVRLNPFRG